MTIKTFPLAKNKILVRVTNLADKFDTSEGMKIQYLNMNQFATQFYKEANKKENQHPTNYELQEVSLSTNQGIEEYRKNKAGRMSFKGIDDETKPRMAQSSPPKDKDNELAFEAQRIRTFIVTYNVKSKEQYVIDDSRSQQKQKV